LQKKRQLLDDDLYKFFIALRLKLFFDKLFCKKMTLDSFVGEKNKINPKPLKQCLSNLVKRCKITRP
jgi:hypothetical protein